ncbi:hypothetical protein QJS10_CPA03g01165 [Acorus calamus]|uniref:Uncharacterized protein n=1 Tax=Acorus calamus TaxID=4465 RepID=A0AAV9F3G6_ACOCL|nr:hypothetical protein QJS10_CPA03g01165 [Acorus calamus]
MGEAAIVDLLIEVPTLVLRVLECTRATHTQEHPLGGVQTIAHYGQGPHEAPPRPV